MTELPEDFDHGEMSPELQEQVKAMRARFKATGLVNPPPGSPEAQSPFRVWWRKFWASQPE